MQDRAPQAGAGASYITVTECASVVQPVTSVARTHVAAERVGAVPVPAQAVVFLALVYVLQDHLFGRTRVRLPPVMSRVAFKEGREGEANVMVCGEGSEL